MSTPDPAPRETTAVVLARIEGTINVVALQITSLARNQDDHETRIRALEARPAPIDHEPRLRELERRPVTDQTDHETRIRQVEDRATVSPRQLGAAAVTLLGALATISPLLARIYGG